MYGRPEREKTALERWGEVKDLADDAPGYSERQIPWLKQEARDLRRFELEKQFRDIFAMHIQAGLTAAKALEHTRQWMDGSENFLDTMNETINKLIEKEMGI